MNDDSIGLVICEHLVVTTCASMIANKIATDFMLVFKQMLSVKSKSFIDVFKKRKISILSKYQLLIYNERNELS